MNPAGMLVGPSLEREARRMVAFAHEPEHYLHPSRGESPERTYPAHLVYRMKEPNWETTLTFAYSIDVKERRGVRHLSITMSYPGQMTQGELNAGAPSLLEGFESMVRCFFVFNEAVRYQFTALAPVPVVDSRQGRRQGNVHFRTPITFHFLVDHGAVEEASTPPTAPTGRRKGLVLAYTALDRLARAYGSTPLAEGETREERREVLAELYAKSREIYWESRADDGKGDLARAVEKFLAHGSPNGDAFGEPVVIYARGDVRDLEQALEAVSPPPDVSPDAEES